MNFKKAEALIGLIIVFTATVIIAGGIIGLLTFFYKKSSTNKSYVTVLGNKLVSLKDIQALGLCNTSSWARIDYSPLNDIYTLTCENQLGEDVSKFPEIVIISDCSSGNNICKYKFKK